MILNRINRQQRRRAIQRSSLCIQFTVIDTKEEPPHLHLHPRACSDITGAIRRKHMGKSHGTNSPVSSLRDVAREESSQGKRFHMCILIWMLTQTSHLKILTLGAQAMPQCLRACTALAEDLSTAPNPTSGDSQSPVTPAPVDLTASSLTRKHVQTHIHTHTFKTMKYYTK